MIRTVSLQSVGAAIAAAILCSAAASAQDASAPDKTSKFESFASPILFTQGSGGTVSAPSNVTCYFSNVGDKPVSLKAQRIVANNTSLQLNANTCGSESGFELAPKSTCFIGNTGRSSFGYACTVQTKDAASLRGSIELRDASAIVIASDDLRASTGTANDDFQIIASPAFFGAPGQTFAQCTFVNVGSVEAKIRKVRIVRSTGETVFINSKSCGDASQASIVPSKQCTYLAQSIGAASDLRCVGEVTRKADIRATFLIGKAPSVTLNRHPMD